jgi:D-alanine-D-alanine ligase
MSKIVLKKQSANIQGEIKKNLPPSLGPISDLEKHLPSEWWKTLFNSLYIKTDGDVVENNQNTTKEADMIIQTSKIEPFDHILDLCCGQGRHSLELAKRGYHNINGIDRSRYLIQLARKRALLLDPKIEKPRFREGDARKIKLEDNSQDLVMLMGNSFGYFEKEEDDAVVIKEIKRVLRSNGNFIIDVVDGEWISKNFEPRSWEWIDQNHLVCRERTLSSDNSRIIAREVIIHAEKGVLADQFYSERIYTYESLVNLLKSTGFEQITKYTSFSSHSYRNQDLGMMYNRLFITARAPEKQHVKRNTEVLKTTVLLGDIALPDKVKRNGQFNEEDFNTINSLKEALKKIKKFSFSYIDSHKHLIKQLMQSPPEFVFNLCDEGFTNDPFKELHVPALLEMLNIPYSGAGPACLAMCYNKSLVRSIAMQLEIPVPLETYVEPADQVATLPSIFPALIKPNYGDSSMGITKDAVVRSAEELIVYLNELKKQFPNIPILVQEYLSGPEYSVAVIGNQGNYTILPVLEVDYSHLPSDLPPILGYESKWIPDSPYWNSIKYQEAKLKDDAYAQLVNNSILLFERLECRDYARFDFREDEQKNIKLLEVNPNPGWCWDGKMNIMAGFKGLSYENLLELILKAAIERTKQNHN